MRARRVLRRVAVVALLGAAAWGGWRAWPRDGAASDPETPLVVNAVAKRQDLLITVDQTGSLGAKDTTQVMPEIGGTVLWVCENGLLVSKGDLIAQIDPAQTARQIEQLVEQYDAAVRTLEEGKEQRESTLAGLEIKLQRAREEATAFEREERASLRDTENDITFRAAELEKRVAELDVKRRLAAKGLIAATEVEREETQLKADQFRLKRDRTSHELAKSEAEANILDKHKAADQAEEDMAAAKRRADRDVRMAQNSVDSLKMRLDQAREDLEKTAVLAPTAGLLVLGSEGRRGERRPLQEGDEVWQGSQLAQIVDLFHMQVQLELDQPRVTGVKVGQEAIVEVDALPGRTFKGKVVWIGETARRPPLEGTWRTGSETTFPVTIDLPKMKEALMRPGMRANAVIVTRRIEDVITVPAECVFEREEGSIVYVERDGQYQERTVEVGTSSGDYTEIVQGLKQGERVALNDLGGEESGEGHAS